MKKIILVLACLVIVVSASSSSALVISGVPDNLWYQNCYATAEADVYGYWANNGYPNLDMSNIHSEISTLYSNLLTSSGDPGLYARSQGYDFSINTYNVPMTLTSAWKELTTEINAGRPMIFGVVPYAGDMFPNHAVPVIGYNTDANGNLYYGFYTTWTGNGSITWAPFQMFESGVAWSIAQMSSFEPGIDPPVATPESSSLCLLISGLVALILLPEVKAR